MIPLAMSSAGWAVIGAVLGALVGSLAGVIGEAVLSDRREKKLAAGGARLVGADLAFAASTMAGVLEDPNKRWFGYMKFDDAAWNEYRGVLATQLDAEKFEAASQGVVATREVFTSIRKAPTWPDEDWMRLEFESVKGLRAVHVEAVTAYNALADLGGYAQQPVVDRSTR